MGDVAIYSVKGILKNSFPKLAQRYRNMRLRRRAYSVLVKNRESYLYLTGWMENLEEIIPADTDGNQIPWMNYSVIKFLKDRLSKDLNLFEFGSGNSTKFYSRLVRSVVSVEHNKSWFKLVEETLSENAELIFKDKDIDGDYCRAMNSTGQQYDVVIVDGRDRVNCVKQSIKVLTDRGVILLDDCHRERYQEGIEFARDNGFRTIVFENLKPKGTEIDKTMIFYRDGNCLGI